MWSEQACENAGERQINWWEKRERTILIAKRKNMLKTFLQKLQNSQQIYGQSVKRWGLSLLFSLITALRWWHVGLRRKPKLSARAGNSICDCKWVDEVSRVIVRLRTFEKARDYSIYWCLENYISSKNLNLLPIERDLMCFCCGLCSGALAGCLLGRNDSK